MKYLLLSGLAISLGIYWIRRRNNPDRVSADWRREQQRRIDALGIDGVSWKWPVRKTW